MDQSEEKSVHIPYDQKIQPYHQVIAELVCRYTADNASILDIGCGVGHTLSEIRKKRPDLAITAADIDGKCLDITDDRVTLEDKMHINEIDDLFVMSLNFDLIIMSHSLEHMPNPVRTVKEVIKMVKPGGFLILAVPNPVRIPVILYNLRRLHYVNRGHVVAWDRSHWMNFLENILGLDVTCYSEDYVPLPFSNRFSFLRPLERSLIKIIPWFSYSNIAVIRSSGT